MFHLSVIVPVFNEEATVVLTLTKLVAVKEVEQVIIVDDGSTDNSAKFIRQFLKKLSATKKQNSKLKVLFLHKENGGKGSAIQFALPKVTGNYVLIQDADCEYDPADISQLIQPIQKSKATVVYGSRFIGSDISLLFWNRLANSFLNVVINILFGAQLTDMETCYKLLPAELFRSLKLKSAGFDSEPEMTCQILKRGIEIFEVPISYEGRDFSQGKKITWQDGVEAFLVIVRERMSNLL